MQKRNLIDFLNDIAYALEEASGFTLIENEANKMASDIYEEFMQDQASILDKRIVLPRFGDAEHDWSISGAKTLAQEYSIDYWE